MESFAETGLDERIIAAITEMGYEKPTPIQAEAIPHLLESDRDLIGSAQTGTGKTAAFGLPAIHRTDLENKVVQTIVLCPTRELCIQIARDLDDFSKKIKGFSVLPVYGGSSIDTQIRALRRGVHIVVGTPGRTLDLIKRRKLDLSNVERVVLDEADEMLNMGFKEDLNAILSETSSDKQTLLFSATMSKEILRITKNYMDDPLEIKVAKMNKGADTVEHIYYMVQARDRYAVLKRVVDINTDIYGIIFCRTRRETNEVAQKLGRDGYNSDFLNGDLSQGQRDAVMQKFRKRKLQLLVATDVAARGLDVNDLTHVINYNLPDDPEIYVHRSGRTGRAGRKGISIAICHSREGRKIRDIENKGGIKFAKADPPRVEDIVQNQLIRVIDKIKNTKVNEKEIAPFLPEILANLEDLSKEDIIKAMVSTEFSQILEYYKNANDLGSAKGRSGDRDRGSRGDRNDRSSRGDRGDRRRDRDKRDRGPRSDSRDRGKERGPRVERDRPVRTEPRERKPRGSSIPSDKNSAKLFINVGSKNNLDHPKLVELIGETLNTQKPDIGKVEILKKFSFFEMPKKNAAKLIKSLEGSVYENVVVQIEISEEKPYHALPKKTIKRKTGGTKERRSAKSGFSRGKSSSKRGVSSSKGKPRKDKKRR